MSNKMKRGLSIILSFVLAMGLIPGMSLPVYAATETAAYTAKLTFSDSAVEETESGAGYTIDGTSLTITASGTYDLTGSCSEGSVVVKSSDVTLRLDDLTLSSSSTAPIVIKKSCSDVNIHLVDDTTSTITDNEDPANETSSDSTVADAFEGACIKVKTDSSAIFCGGGNLVCVANAKNGIKGGTNVSLTFNTTGSITIKGNYSGYATSAGAVNNGIASDGSLVFNAGTYNVAAANDGIKAVPDSDDTDSEGNVTINGGTFDMSVDGDGIQAEQNLTISAGTINIKTMTGYQDSNFNEDTMSCKGIKASGDRENIENTIKITGGEFTLNTADDAVHSDMYVQVTGGTFDIDTGDDGMHADTSLVLGASGGLERDPDINIGNSYEGLEAGTVYIYSGRHYVCASDDGVNAAGGSSSGSNAGNSGDSFKPGGGGPGSRSSSSSSDYNIHIDGGELYVNCDGDGLDSNGGLYLNGGKQWIFSQGENGDNSAIDADGTVSIDGATILTAGIAGMDGSAQSGWFGSNQKYKTANSSYSTNTVLNAKAGSDILLSANLPKKVSYVMASWPSDLSSTAPTFATASSLSSCKSDSRNHDWKEGSETDGVITYTCESCGNTEQQTVASSASVTECDHSVEVEDITEYTATFSVVDASGADSSNATINTYYTQDYATASETNVTTAVARDSDTGDVDISGSGQINFTVVPEDGYSVSDVSVEGSYKNLKDPSDTGLANTYRITKISGNLTVTITLEKNTYTVEFDANGHGTAPSSQSVEYGGTASQPDDPSETGYTFGGWYQEAACTNVYDFSTAVTADITLYANWAKNKTAGSISYETTEVTKTYGDGTFTNALSNTGDGSVTYASNAEAVATVEASTGAVTITGAGSATITATVEDSDNYSYETKTASYKLIVNKAESTTTESTTNVKTGWQTINGKRYYYTQNGKMVTGWKTISGKRYYFADSKWKGYTAAQKGMMLTGFKTISGKRYYFADSKWKGYTAARKGMMVTGWKTISGRRYYFADSKWKGYTAAQKGMMVTGWKTISGKKYYFADSKWKAYKTSKKGMMLTGWKIISGKKYYFNKSGVLTKK